MWPPRGQAGSAACRPHERAGVTALGASAEGRDARVLAPDTGAYRPRETDRVTTVRELAAGDDGWKRTTLEAGWGSTCVARLGELIDAAELPGFVAELDGRRAGLATYVARPDGIEVATIHALTEGRGVGRSLMDRVRDLAIERHAPRVWLITTNDNTRAFAFYQRWGMDLVDVVHDGVSVSRRVKPTIPEIGSSGVACRHEIQFELRLSG